MVTTPVRRAYTARVGRISLGFVLIVIAVVVALTPRPNAEVRPVDYSAQLARATAQAPYEIAAPADLSPGWRTTSVRFFTHDGGTRWHLGLVTPSGEHAGIDQIDTSRRPFVDLVTGGGRPENFVTIDGLSWGKRFVEDRNLRSLVHEHADSVIVISGKADFAELIELADALLLR